ncbi:hypothetical protein K437DRAFT_235875 [Tilletiaria anomala UBC 951]|uniref:VPS9 domain-containing protein n=1 Tax=Tilletiaria anomala (strain ATCC 24038 / CBS 436.72 / UBC 951) TaxID=1037660 RepID=A0A066VVH2_TILAU|nr:uncharacterized protein K437DRAFT_235875 [Tilletiaria anomala UBC 951]KDN45476.1 hypothetical protein K437DRAFT_235875 [Tilletiaria anomala UBC 951]
MSSAESTEAAGTLNAVRPTSDVPEEEPSAVVEEIGDAQLTHTKNLEAGKVQATKGHDAPAQEVDSLSNQAKALELGGEPMNEQRHWPDESAGQLLDVNNEPQGAKINSDEKQHGISQESAATGTSKTANADKAELAKCESPTLPDEEEAASASVQQVLPETEGQQHDVQDPKSESVEPIAPSPVEKTPPASAPEVPRKDVDGSLEAVAHAFGKGTSTPSHSRSASPVIRAAAASGSGSGSKRQSGDSSRAEKAPTSSGKEGEGRQPKRKESIPNSKAAEEAPFDFNKFLEQMKHRGAAPVGEYVRSFIRGFSRKPYRTNDQIKLINDFLAFIHEQMANTPPWSTLSGPEFDNAKEAMEKLVMNRLYPFTFSPAVAKEGRWPVQTDDLERDSVLNQKMRLFEWVKEEHLDVPTGEHSRGFVEFGVTELLKINHYKAPRDKLICVLNCSKVIFGLIRHLYQGEDADTFLPILIFIVLRARPEHLISNVEYINRFRSPERLSSESGYYLSSLMGAISFIEQMEFSSFSNLTQEDFERNIEVAAARLAEESKEMDRRERSASDGGHGDGVGEEEARSIGLTPVAAALADDTRAFLQRTGEAARLGMSKPIGVIGRFLSEATDGIRTPSSVGTASGSGSESGRESPPQRVTLAPFPPDTPKSGLLGMSTSESSQVARDGSAAERLSGFSFGSWRGSRPPDGGGEQPQFGPQTPTSAHSSTGHGNSQQPAAARRSWLGAPAQLLADTPCGDSPASFALSFGDGRAPDSPSVRLADAGRNPQVHTASLGWEMSAGDLADISAQAERVYRDKMDAAVETLKGIFPETEHDVCMMVLESCNGDVQAAIDRLLEMS